MNKTERSMIEETIIEMGKMSLIGKVSVLCFVVWLRVRRWFFRRKLRQSIRNAVSPTDRTLEALNTFVLLVFLASLAFYLLNR